MTSQNRKLQKVSSIILLSGYILFFIVGSSLRWIKEDLLEGALFFWIFFFGLLIGWVVNEFIIEPRSSIQSKIPVSSHKNSVVSQIDKFAPDTVVQAGASQSSD